MRRLARTVLAVQLAVAALLGIAQAAASAQPSAPPSPSPSETSSSSATASSMPTPTGSTPAPTPTAAATSASPTAPPPTPAPSMTSTTPPPPPATISIATTSVEVVAQVGDLVHYRAVVSNDAATGELRRVFVVGFLPPEVTFVSADLLPEVEATLYNRIGTEESITWNVGEIAPGDALTLAWTARVTSSGDMTATGAVRAVAEGAPRVRQESSTYLATTSTLGGPNPSPSPTTTRVVTYERVSTGTGTTLGTSAEPGGAVVPETGFDGTLAVSVAALLVGLGALLWWAASPSPRRRRRVVLALAVLALLAACTSGRDLERASPQATGSPQVKGRRIGPGGQVRDLGEDNGRPEDEATDAPEGEGPENDGATTPEGPADDAPEPVETDAPEGGTRLIRQVAVFPVDAVLDPTTRLRSHDGHGSVTYAWNGFGIEAIQSSTRTDREPVRVETTVRERDSTLEARVTITNTSTATPVLVDGALGLEIGGSATATLSAAPSRVTLMPGGSTAASFTYDLPPGAYSSRGFFTAR